MNPIQVLVFLVQALAEREAPKLLAWALPKLGGSGAFAAHFLGLAPVQDWLKAEEAKAAQGLDHLLDQGWAAAEQALLAHLPVAVSSFLRSKLTDLGSVTFTADQVAVLSALALKGDLPGVLQQAAADKLGWSL